MTAPTVEKPKRRGQKPGSQEKRSAKRIATAESDAEALELRKQGLTYREISRRMGWASPHASYNAVERSFAKLTYDGATQLRQLESERLDALLAGLWPKASQGDPQAVNSALRVMERRARMFGLDLQPGATLDVQVTANDPEAREEVAALADRLSALAGVLLALGDTGAVGAPVIVGELAAADPEPGAHPAP